MRPPGTGEEFDVPASEMCYFVQPSPADPFGAVSAVQAAAAAINVDFDIQTTQRAAMARGCFPAMAVVCGKEPHPDVPASNWGRPRLTEQQRRQIIEAIRRRFEGPHRAGQIVVLDALIEKVERLSFAPDEMAFSELSKDTRERILMAFGISPYSLGSSEPGSRAASAVADYHFCRNVVNPLISLLNSGLQEWYLPVVAPDDDRLIVWIEPAEPFDPELEHQRMTLAAQMGVLTANELRRYAGLPEDETFEGQLVGGQNLGTTGMIATGVRNLVGEAVGDYAAEGLLRRAGLGGNGNGAVERP